MGSYGCSIGKFSPAKSVPVNTKKAPFSVLFSLLLIVDRDVIDHFPNLTAIKYITAAFYRCAFKIAHTRTSPTIQDFVNTIQ